MKYFAGSRSRFYALITVPLVLAVATLTTIAVSHHSSKSPAPTHSTTSSPTPSTGSSTVDNYPPSRFQAGRPSGVEGLTLASVDPIHKIITLKWDSNPSNEGVDEYALYYQQAIPTDDPYIGHGILAAVVKDTSIRTTIIREDIANSATYAPYGENEIPICTLAANCATGPINRQPPYQIMVWVVAHNKYGWGNNDSRTPNPDENPANFSHLSYNQSLYGAVANQPISFGFSEKLFLVNQLDPKFSSIAWPVRPKTISSNPTTHPSDHTPWTVPWLPDVELPLSRFGPGRPSNVTHLQLAKLDANLGKLTLKWSPNPQTENVDEYAIYYSYDFESDVPITRVKLVAVVEGTSFNGNLKPGSQDPHGIQNPNGTHHFFVEGYPDYPVWVVAHNKNGWGDNDPLAINPDQAEYDYRTLSATEISKLKLPSTIHLTLNCNSTLAKKYGC